MNISIEYAHIYTNNRIDDEHRLSLQILKGLKEQHHHDHLSLVVMVDDYSFPDPTFDYTSFSTWLSEQGHTPDLMIRESQLIPLCDQVLTVIDDDSVKQPIVDYVKAKKYPCSLFIAAWYLARLGYIKSDIIPKASIAERLINILPESFKPFEDKGLEVIAATPFAAATQQIGYRFIDQARLIA